MTSPLRERTPEEPWQDFGLVQRAARFAADAHRFDTRKGGTIPYLSHLWAVAGLVLEHGGDDRQVAAALLHDVVEDAGGIDALVTIRADFGDDVAAIVEALSDSVVDTTTGVGKAPWRDRKTTYIAQIQSAGDRVALVAACDKLHNARTILTDLRATGPALWDRFTADAPSTLWYYESVLDAVAHRIPTGLRTELERTVAEMRAIVTSPR